MANDTNQYILGTERRELHRLGVQHQVWSSEARRGWEIAEFSDGHTILDLGCGPGFCTIELAYLVGQEGKVIAVDKSQAYIDFLNQQTQLHELNIESICVDFDDLDIPDNSLDGIYCRWALAWVPNPEEILEKLERMLVPGGAVVFQEYYDWSTFQTQPHYGNLSKGISTILQSFHDSPGNINIGKELGSLLYDHGMEVISQRPMSKLALPDTITWQWPQTFLEIYMPKLIDGGSILKDEVERALSELDQLYYDNGATIFCPMMVEVVAIKGA